MEEMHWPSYREGHGASMLSPGTPPSLNLHLFTNLEDLWTHSFDFSWRFQYRGTVVKSLASGDWVSLQPRSSSWKLGEGGAERITTLSSLGSSLGIMPSLVRCFSKFTFTRCGRNSLLWITRHPFYLYSSELISRTESLRETKTMFMVTVIVWSIRKIYLVIQMTKIYFSYIFGLPSQFLAHSSQKPLEFPEQ